MTSTPRITSDIRDAAERLRRGQLVAFPTETVYGLGADALNPAAVRTVFRLKQRPPNNPLIVHVDSVAMARTLVTLWPNAADALARAFWPGPLTIALPRAPIVPDIVTAGGPTVAIRMPDHPAALALIAALAAPIVGPSANPSGSISPTRAEHVHAAFGDTLTVLDGGPSSAGIESTVVRIQSPSHQPAAITILRPGVIRPDELADTLDRAAITHRIEHPRATKPTSDHPLPSPGLLARHYAPRTPAQLVALEQLPSALSPDHPAAVLAPSSTAIPPPHAHIPMPDDAPNYARTLYDALHRADALAFSRILVVRPDQTSSAWDAIRDRLHRACAP